MKMRFLKAVFSVLLAILMLSTSAMAVRYVTFDDIPGDWNNYESPISWMNVEYTPTSDYTYVGTHLLEGGQVSPGVFEFIADPAYAYENPNVACANLYIDAPGEILYVSAFEGNWETHEYMFMNCVATDGTYVDVFLPSFDRDGKLLNTDRVYLYEYESDGEWHYECVTFYFRYDGEETRTFLPEVVKNEPEKQSSETNEPEAETDDVITAEDIFASDDDVTASDIFASDDPVIAENEQASIGIIGGADGPTSVIVGEPGSAFGAFFSNVLEGLINGAQNSPVSETEPVVELEEIEPTEEVIEEIIEETTEEAAEEPAGEQGSKFFEFFSNAFGG